MPPVLTLEVESENFKKIERFTIILYDKTSHLTSVNECRNDLFCHMNRSMANFPPTLNFLLQHARRAVYQAGIRTTCKQPQPHIPSRRDFAWTETSGFNNSSILSKCDFDALCFGKFINILISLTLELTFYYTYVCFLNSIACIIV